jgi:hypothetical protein
MHGLFFFLRDIFTGFCERGDIMRIIPLDKNMFSIMEAIGGDEYILFVTFEKRRLANGDVIGQLRTKTVSKCSIPNIKVYLNDPEIMIVKIEP